MNTTTSPAPSVPSAFDVAERVLYTLDNINSALRAEQTRVEHVQTELKHIRSNQAFIRQELQKARTDAGTDEKCIDKPLDTILSCLDEQASRFDEIFKQAPPVHAASFELLEKAAMLAKAVEEHLCAKCTNSRDRERERSADDKK